MYKKIFSLLKREYARLIFRRRKCDFQVLAMQRSGHHAVINWIMGMTDKSVLYNECNVYGVPNNIDGDKNAPCRYRNFENFKPENCKFKYEKSILVIRDPKNQFASYRKRYVEERNNGRVTLSHPFNTKEDASILADIWKSHVKEAIGETRILDNNTVIIFDRWFDDVNYRKSIAEKIGLNFNDSGKNKLSNYGGGSSFENKSYSQNPEQMKVKDRWRIFLNDPVYLSVFRDKELLMLANKLGFELNDVTD